jgi:hypothetical protein
MPNIEPRWQNASSVAPRLQFLGQAGPLDLWLDHLDTIYPYCFMWATQCHDWAADAADIINKAKRYVHLTLHDECMIYQMVEENNLHERKP